MPFDTSQGFIAAAVVASLVFLAFTGVALFFRRGWVERGIWAPSWWVLVSGALGLVSCFSWLWATQGWASWAAFVGAVPFGAFVQYSALAVGSDARGWLIAREITWPPIAVGIGCFVAFLVTSHQGLYPSSGAGMAALVAVALVVAAVGWFFYGPIGIPTGAVGAWFAYLLLENGYLGGLLLLTLAAMFSVRAGFGMGFGDVRMAGAAAASLYFLPLESVLAALILFVISAGVWAVFDNRKQTPGKNSLHRKIPLAPAYCGSLVVVSLVSVAVLA